MKTSTHIYNTDNTGCFVVLDFDTKQFAITAIETINLI